MKILFCIFTSFVCMPALASSDLDWNPENLFGSMIRCDQTYDLAEISLNPFLRIRTIWIGPENANNGGSRIIWFRSLGRDEAVSYNENPRDDLAGIYADRATCQTTPASLT